MKIFHASGDSYGEPGRDYTPAEAAEIVRYCPWAETDPDGDIIVKEYRSRYPGHKEVRGAVMARRLGSRA